jgi:flagellar basal-body rod protein FlgC
MPDSLMRLFDISGSAMSAQTIRLNTIASNVANANHVSRFKADSFQALKTVFESRYAEDGSLNGVEVTDIVTANQAPIQEFSPQHPMADSSGYIYRTPVNIIEELTDSMSASRALEVNAYLMESGKKMIERLLQLGN